MKSGLSCGAAAAALLAYAAPAAAQDAVQLAVADTAPPGESTVSELVVVGHDRTDEIPGSVTVVDAETYERSQPLSVNDVLRRVPGLYPRTEEGLGLRPNIGFRGLNPTRSTEVLLLEDGVPLAYAPYGDNASYYHPPIERFSGVEVLKGAGQIIFGPHTVGGVINYLTPRPPLEREGRLILRAGNRETREVVLQGGDTIGRLGLFGSLAARESQGTRANTHLRYGDLFLKGVYQLSDVQELTLRLSSYAEDNQVSYTGLTEAEYRADPRGNPFPNDRFETARHAASLSHGLRLGENAKLTTVVYGSTFQRDWWRQSSNSSQRPNDASDPLCAGMANLSTTCGNEGRLRQYHLFGVETRLSADWSARGLDGRVDAGLRAHTENQERFQWNGDLPNSRSPGTGVNAGVREQTVRQARALAGYVQNTLDFGDFGLSGGLRYETIAYEQSNKLNGTRGASDLQALIPGLGATWSPDDRLTVFAGVHRGFSPPRVEDVLTGSGTSVELDEEKSTNWEFGVRGRPIPGLHAEATLFRMDFANQIVPSSVAGGAGATLTSAGETLHQGIEGAFDFSSKEAFGTTIDWYAEGTATWVRTAEYSGRRFSSIPGFTNVSVTGNRLPYAPEWIARFAVGFDTGAVQAELEAQYTGEMVTDDLNTGAPTPNGQRGLIDDAVQWNAAASWAVPNTPVKLLLSVRNLFDETSIVDRSRGILVNEPRLAQVGLELRF